MRHEQAGLVAVSYVIGFTTAFIAFALNEPDPAVAPILVHSQVQPASAVSAFTNSEGLFARVGTEERFLSAKVEANPEGAAGRYLSVHGVSVSPDGQYVHFCERISEASQECWHYLYRVESDSVVRVKVDGAHLRSAIEGLEVSWEGGKLRINDYAAISAEEPWYVTAK